MLASALNPPANGKSSILPLLAASYQNLPEVEGVIRPRLPVIQMKVSVVDADEHEEEDVESTDGYHDGIDGANEEDVTIAPSHESSPSGDARDPTPTPASAMAFKHTESVVEANNSSLSQPNACSDLGKRQADEALLSSQQSKRPRYDTDTADIASTEPASEFALPSAPVDIPSTGEADTKTHTTTILPTQDFASASGATIQPSSNQGTGDDDEDDDDDFEVPTLVLGVDSDEE